jgi:hypothetical protein
LWVPAAPAIVSDVAVVPAFMLMASCTVADFPIDSSDHAAVVLTFMMLVMSLLQLASLHVVAAGFTYFWQRSTFTGVPTVQLLLSFLLLLVFLLLQAVMLLLSILLLLIVDVTAIAFVTDVAWVLNPTSHSQQ